MSTITENITASMKTAMRAKDSVTLGALRAVKSAFQNAEIAKGSVNSTLDTNEEQSIIRKQIKQREDAIVLYKQAGRSELVDKEAAEIKVLSVLLPAEMTQDEIAAMLELVVADLGASSKKDMGRVMKEMQARSEGRAAGKTLSQLVGARLS